MEYFKNQVLHNELVFLGKNYFGLVFPPNSTMRICVISQNADVALCSVHLVAIWLTNDAFNPPHPLSWPFIFISFLFLFFATPIWEFSYSIAEGRSVTGHDALGITQKKRNCTAAATCNKHTHTRTHTHTPIAGHSLKGIGRQFQGNWPAHSIIAWAIVWFLFRIFFFS